MKFNKEENRKIFKQLPKNLQEAIMSVDNANILAEIGKKYKLHIDKRAIIGELVGLVMLGRIEPNEFNNKIEKELDIPKEEANEITKEVDEKIFAPIKENLIEISEDQSEDVGEELNETEPAYQIKNTERERNDLLKEIENPSPTESAFTKKDMGGYDDSQEESVSRYLENDVAEDYKDDEKKLETDRKDSDFEMEKEDENNEEIEEKEKLNNVKNEEEKGGEETNEEGNKIKIKKGEENEKDEGIKGLKNKLDIKESRAPTHENKQPIQEDEDIFERKFEEKPQKRKLENENSQTETNTEKPKNYREKDPYREKID